MEVQVQHANSAGSRFLIVFVHGNGLTKSVFRQCITSLFALNKNNANFNALHCLSIDLPGHGENTTRSGEVMSKFTKVSSFAPYIADVVQTYCAKQQFDRKIIVGHSVGAQMCLFAHKLLRFDHAVLIEPSIAQKVDGKRIPPPAGYVEKTKTRRRTFPSLQAAFDSLRPRGMLSTWEDECVRDYVFHGAFRPAASSASATGREEVELSCDPELEAHIFELDITEVESELEDFLFQSSSVIVGANSTIISHDEFQNTASKLNSRYVVVKGAGHQVMCEKPQSVAKEIYEILKSDAMLRAKLM